MRTIRMPLVPITSLFSLLFLLVAVPALAQDWAGRGRLRGIVVDAENRPIEGASVELLKDGEAGRGPDAFLTGKKGRWNYTGLVTGGWTVRISKEGYRISEGQVSVSEYGGGPGPEIKVVLNQDHAAQAAAQAEETMGHLEKGNALLQQQEFALARVEFEAALADLDEKQTPIVRKAIGDSFLAEGKWAEARAIYQEVLPQAPEDLKPAIRRDIARSWHQEGEVDEAVAALDEILVASPDDVDTLRLIINVLIAEGREEAAEPYMARLPEGEKVDANALLNLGITAFNAGDIPTALGHFDRVVQENPENADAYYYRGLAYLNGNETDKAKADLQKMLEIAPDHANAEEAKQYLEYL